jgi:hypothetical protein
MSKRASAEDSALLIAALCCATWTPLASRVSAYADEMPRMRAATCGGEYCCFPLFRSQLLLDEGNPAAFRLSADLVTHEQVGML